MTFLDTSRIALRAIIVNKTRSLLTMLGVIIGVGAVIMLIAIGNGIQQYITGQFDQLGANTISILPGDIFSSDGGFASEDAQISAFANNKLKLSDVRDIRRLREYVAYVTPMMMNTGEASFLTTTKKVSITGVSDEYPMVRNLEMNAGKFYTKQDDDNSRRVAVLGYKISKDLFGTVDPVGKKITVNGQSFTVLGSVKEMGGGFGGPQVDAYIYIPLNTYQQIFNTSVISSIVVKTKSKDDVKEAVREIENVLGKRLEDDEYSVFETTEILKVINQILGVMTVGLGGIAAISLVVGGIGIMNIMLVSVTERTREIGLRKAIGATPNQILLQFLIESSLLSVLGGGIGVALAFLGTLILQNFFPAAITLSSIALAFGVSAAIGIVFGVAPARRASQLSPIEALRYE